MTRRSYGFIAAVGALVLIAYFLVVQYSHGENLTISNSATSTVIKGSLSVIGTLSKGSGTFIIDDPIDPKNKLLYHSFVESPNPVDLYDGVATLDSKGDATIVLPDYFLALNDDFQYLTTAIGQPMPDLHLAQGVQREYFDLYGPPAYKIAGGVPGGEVSWQVTGVRRDPAAIADPADWNNEVAKGPEQPVNVGKYLCPECYGIATSTQ
jgi:hypothetical protein